MRLNTSFPVFIDGKKILTLTFNEADGYCRIYSKDANNIGRCLAGDGLGGRLVDLKMAFVKSTTLVVARIVGAVRFAFLGERTLELDFRVEERLPVAEYAEDMARWESMLVDRLDYEAYSDWLEERGMMERAVVIRERGFAQ